MTVKQIRAHCRSYCAEYPFIEPKEGFEIWYLERPTGRAVVAPPDMLMGEVPYPYFYNDGACAALLLWLYVVTPPHLFPCSCHNGTLLYRI